MSDRRDTPAAGGPTSRRAWAHFGVAAGVLLVAAVGWNVLLAGATFAKKPVPLPTRTPPLEVSEHRLRSFPGAFGDFVLDPDAERKDSVARGRRDGIHEYSEEELEVLGTLKHAWNWYYSGVYRDTRVPAKDGRWVQLDLTYYTGLLEAVPHVPEVCIGVGGGEIQHDLSKDIDVSVPGLPRPSAKLWKNIKVRRIVYEYTDSRGARRARGAQYYFFSANGGPEYRRWMVRWTVGDLWKTYCYFAKVQLAPSGHGLDSWDKTDAYCQDFLRQALPEILKVLPTAEDVRGLEVARGRPDRPHKQRN